ncbi:hypothetical protein [Ruegeria sp.]|uniref:hypothetical protein n=1 Tax=Ruegeria sp. TaxID=1879320 RepID=UPI002310FBB0|nr:hypothetical protein [Ruegeria sp.]MDA7964126.1 hypothetical protein [Ruegeria sp.]
MGGRAQIILSLLALALLVALLAVVPRLVPPDPNLPNVAALRGYNINLAWILIFLWAVLTILAASLIRLTPVKAPGTPVTTPISAMQRWAERLVVTLPALLVYWPAALARFGPHVEDTYFLTALHRMSCGQQPYQDFEFLYGPLMIAPAGMLMGDVFTPLPYYTLYAGLQAGLLLIIMALLQRLIPQTGKRWLVFILLLPFWFDVLLGLNWIGWRYLAALVAILLLARAPKDIKTVLVTATLLGLGAGYSHEYAIAGLVASIAILALDGWARPGAMVLRMGVLVVGAVAVWSVVTLWALGDLSAYLNLTAQVMARASQAGLGQFAFGWSLHTLTLFALLAAACVAAGSGLRRLPQIQAQEGDLLLLGTGVFAVITLKIALQRADFLHMAVPFVPLILIWLAGRPMGLFTISPTLQRFGVVLIVLAALAQMAGHLPLGRWVLPSAARGLYHEVTGRAQVGNIDARGPTTQSLRSTAQPDQVTLAARLAEPDLRARPVLFYGGLWKLAPETGVCPAGFSFYDILYSDDHRPLAATAQTEGLIVVIHADDLAALRKEAQADTRPDTGPSLQAWISGDTASQSALETGIEFRMWQQALGEILAKDFVIKEQSGPYLLMERGS